MELYLTIHSEGDEPLGSVAAVGAALSALFPGFAVEPVLMRGFARPANLDANGLITFSAPPWAALGPVPTMLGGEVEGPGVVATFYWWSPGPVREVTAKLAGDRPAVEAALSRLSGQPGWVVEPGVECEVPDAEPGAAADGGGR